MRTVPGHFYKKLAWFPPVNSHLSFSLVTALLFYPRDCPSWIKCSFSVLTLWTVTHCSLFRLEVLLRDWSKIDSLKCVILVHDRLRQCRQFQDRLKILDISPQFLQYLINSMLQKHLGVNPNTFADSSVLPGTESSKLKWCNMVNVFLSVESAPRPGQKENGRGLNLCQIPLCF